MSQTLQPTTGHTVSVLFKATGLTGYMTSFVVFFSSDTSGKNIVAQSTQTPAVAATGVVQTSNTATLDLSNVAAGDYYVGVVPFINGTQQPAVMLAPGTDVVIKAVTPSLSISPVSAPQTAIRLLTYAGFQPNASVYTMIVRTDGGSTWWTATMDSSGSYAMAISLGSNYIGNTIQATDNYGHTATVTFTIANTYSSYILYAIVLPQVAYRGTARNVIFAGFQPNALVNCLVIYNCGSFTMMADSNGGGNYPLPLVFSDVPGSYALQLTDTYGHELITAFLVT